MMSDNGMPPEGWFDCTADTRSSPKKAARAPKPNSARVITSLFKRGDQVEVGQAFLSRLRDQGDEVVFDDGALYRYDRERHVFTVVPESEQSRILQGFAGSRVGRDRVPLKLKRSDIVGAMKLAWDSATDVGFFAAARAGIAFENSFVEVTAESIVQHPHSPDHRARFSYPFPFVASAQPTAFLKYLGDVFRDDDDAEEKASLIQEYMGISLLGLAPRYQRSLTSLGPGANGKSVLMEVAEKAMPTGACCAIAPQNWGQEYRVALLAGKRLNLVSELPEAEIMNSEAFKAVVTGDAMTGRHIRQAPFMFRPVAGHVFAANRLPPTNDQSHGFWRRHLIITFNRVFEKHEQDAKLADTLIATELPLIVSYFLEGARRLLEQGEYTIPPSSDVAVSAWRLSADQVRGFLAECTHDLPLDAPKATWARADRLYQTYRSWAERSGHRPLASNSFGQRMGTLKGSAHTNTGSIYPVRLIVAG